MKRIIYLVSISLITSIIFINCNDSISSNNGDLFQVTVLGKGIDCGDTYLIKFNEGQNILKALSNNESDLYYADNLPKELKFENIQVLIKFRNPTTGELYPCTTLGFPYPHIIILEAKRK